MHFKFDFDFLKTFYMSGVFYFFLFFFHFKVKSVFFSSQQNGNTGLNLKDVGQCPVERCSDSDSSFPESDSRSDPRDRNPDPNPVSNTNISLLIFCVYLPFHIFCVHILCFSA